MFETAFPIHTVHPDLLSVIAATPTDLAARVERLEARLETVVTARQEPDGPGEPRADEWVWEGNRARRRLLDRPFAWRAAP